MLIYLFADPQEIPMPKESDICRRRCLAQEGS